MCKFWVSGTAAGDRALADRKFERWWGCAGGMAEGEGFAVSELEPPRENREEFIMLEEFSCGRVNVGGSDEP